MDQQGADSNFSATTRADGEHLTVTVAGEVDMATAETMYAAATPSGVARLTLDLRAVTFFDSAAIHALVRLAGAYGEALAVLPSSQVRRVLDISGLGDQPWLEA
ncbi:STAS domain-containing protein [Polymorphospora rubra]|uniref:STAS domain-containing protein n=1 Tax=Polymorphospora rubra TaxID=338584 RepID=UPI0033CADB27